MIRGCVARFRSIRRQLPWDDVYDFFASRIIADREASLKNLPISSLGVTPTNAFLAVPPIHPVKRNEVVVQDSIVHGVPLAVKDNFCTDYLKWTLPTTCSSRFLQNYRAPYDATVVNSLMKAGCMLMGKTNMDEFAMGCGSTDGKIAPPVINPWSCKQRAEDSSQNPVVAGGSSGGSAAAVASGMCVLALASDTGGSARLPAAHCGVVGFKPTYGFISRHGLIPLANSLDVPSIMALHVADIGAVLATWLQPGESSARINDATCAQLSTAYLKQMLTEFNDLADSSRQTWQDIHNIRLGIPEEYHVPGLWNEVADLWDRVAGLLADSELSCSVRRIRLPHTPLATAVYSVLCATEVASNMTRYDGLRYGHRAKESLHGHSPDLDTMESLFAVNRSEGFGEVVRSRILAGNFFLLRGQRGRHLDAARRLWRLIIEDFREAFSEVDFLLTPVTVGPAPKLRDFVQLDNRTRTTLEDVCTVGVNLAGLPAVSIPIGLSPSTGLPLGLQLIGPMFSEPRLLRLAAFIESRVQFPYLVDVKALIDGLQ